METSLSSERLVPNPTFCTGEFLETVLCLSTLPQEAPQSPCLWSDRAGEESPVRHIVSLVILSETHRPVAITNCGRRANRSDKTSFTGESEDVIGQKLCKWQMHVTCH